MVYGLLAVILEIDHMMLTLINSLQAYLSFLLLGIKEQVARELF